MPKTLLRVILIAALAAELALGSLGLTSVKATLYHKMAVEEQAQ